MDQYRFPALPKYWSMPYTLRNGDEQVLSRWNMMQESGYVSRICRHHCTGGLFRERRQALRCCPTHHALGIFPNLHHVSLESHFIKET